MIGYEADKRWSDRFLPEIKATLGLYLIGEASREEDQRRNTDLIVLHMDAVRIACRVRRNKYMERYGDEFTIRSGRPQSGFETELAKILYGWGNYFFYGFSDESETHLAKWTLGDLGVFRLWFQRQSLRLKRCPGLQRVNGDESSDFLVFSLTDMPSGFVVASSQDGKVCMIDRVGQYAPHEATA